VQAVPPEADQHAVTDADVRRNAASLAHYLRRIPNRFPDALTIRHGDTIRVAYPHSAAGQPLEQPYLDVTDEHGTLWYHAPLVRTGVGTYRVGSEQRAPERGPDPGAPVREPARGPAPDLRGAGRGAEPRQHGGEPGRPGAADRGDVPDTESDAWAEHWHAVRPFRHTHYHQHPHPGVYTHGIHGGEHAHGTDRDHHPIGPAPDA
jgi:hypothetical protein